VITEPGFLPLKLNASEVLAEVDEMLAELEPEKPITYMILSFDAAKEQIRLYKTDPEAYIVLPTIRKSDGVGRKTKGEPFRIYAVARVDGTRNGIIGRPPFYRVAGFEAGKLVMEEMDPHAIPYKHLAKWVSSDYHRMIFHEPRASALATEEQVIKLLSR
jgi:hypothetical protein